MRTAPCPSCGVLCEEVDSASVSDGSLLVRFECPNSCRRPAAWTPSVYATSFFKRYTRVAI